MEALAALLALALLFVCVRFVAYRGSHPHTRGDLEDARRQSVRISRATRHGKAYEQFVPLLPEFEEQYDRADARFLGAPIDFLVFDGLYSDDEDLAEIVFLEIKSARPTLNSKEQADPSRGRGGPGPLGADRAGALRTGGRTSAPEPASGLHQPGPGGPDPGDAP